MIRRLLITVLIVCLIAPLSAFAGACCRANESAIRLTDEACCPATTCTITASQCPANSRIQQAILPTHASCEHLKSSLETASGLSRLSILNFFQANHTVSPFYSPPGNSLFSLSLPLRL